MEKYLILINISRLQYRKHSAKKIYICNQDEHFILTNNNYNNTQPTYQQKFYRNNHKYLFNVT